jgi:hypothetical protein
MPKKNPLSSPAGVFVIYAAASLVIIGGFRFIFPGQPAPLRIFSVPWRITRGALDFIGLFPALALSSLVIPFGAAGGSREPYARFSPRFLELLKAPILTAMIATVVYGLLFFLALPVLRDIQSNMRFEGQLFRLSRERAEEYAADAAWPEAAQLIALCDSIWPDSPETASLRVAVSIGLDEYRNTPGGSVTEGLIPRRSPADEGIPGQQNPVEAAEALALAERALREERFYDAHWLANLGGRLARTGSAEAGEAARLASMAWNAISSLEPNAREARVYGLYHQKREGYEAMVSEDWVRAYYIFKDLAEKTPGDPDVANFMVMCERGVASVAFFTDEIQLAVGDILTGPVFSLPGSPGGRSVLRLSSLSAFSDFSFGMGMELVSYDARGDPAYTVEAPYVKILPITLGSSPRLLLLMRALDRRDERVRWEPVWTGAGRSGPGDAQMVLDMSYDQWLLLSKVPRGTENLLIGELFAAADTLGDYGYIPQVFQAEALRRFAEPAVFLPVAVLGIVIGWRYRAKKRSRYTGVPMLIILPLVFNGLVHVYRNAVNTLGIYLVISLGFPMAALIFITATVLLFILALISLAAQHG